MKKVRPAYYAKLKAARQSSVATAVAPVSSPVVSDEQPAKKSKSNPKTSKS